VFDAIQPSDKFFKESGLHSEFACVGFR
jgi:hypothetical protein